MTSQTVNNSFLFPETMFTACPHFPISEILLVTQNFNDELVIGQGGFGKVYKGTLKTGTKSVVAIKRLDAGSAQGATEFWAEVEMLSRLRHCNLVPLIGYCNDNREMILVYEYMPNGTLEDHLHKLHTPLSFSQRLKMCIGAARGLHYLHTGTGTEHGIIHRDVKSSNILLDDNWAAKISDFGLSKISPIDKPLTGVNTLIKGTFGYFDPNYFSTGRLTRKSDVFSFGVILLEVLCRKRAVDSSLDEEQWSLVEWAQDFMKGGKLKEIIDPHLKGEISRKCLNGYAKLVDGCLHRSPKQRITMTEVVSGLESILVLHKKSGNSIPIAFGRKFLKHLLSAEETSFSSEETSFSTEKTYAIGRIRKSELIPEPTHTLCRRKDIFPKNVLGELETDGWPSWLTAFTGEALKDWLPRRASTLEKLDKIEDNVYKARDIQTGNFVALKRFIYNPSDPERVKRMAMEIAILRHLDHPNVIKLEGIVTSRTSQSLYLVFEYMDDDLRTLTSFVQLEEPQVRHYMRQLFSGLKYCHDHHVLHRDLTGSHLLVDSSGILKIAYFDFASFFDLVHEQPLNHHGANYWYQAPELILGATEYGVGVDLWSAGCILAELFSKKRPILTGRTQEEQLMKIFALCGSPPDEYWTTNKFPWEILYKPTLQYKRCLRETFRDFPPSSLTLLDVILSIDPAKRQNAEYVLKSTFLSDMS